MPYTSGSLVSNTKDAAAKLPQYKKAVAYALTFVSEAVALGVLHGTALYVAQAVLAAAGFAGVVAARNAPKPAPKA